MSAYFDALNRRSTIAVFAPAPQQTVRIPSSPQRLTAPRVPTEYAKLHERLMVSANGRPLRTLVFAGCDGGEGCTGVTRQFAEALASSGLNMLLVDADLRNSEVRRSLSAGGPDLATLVKEGRCAPGTACGNGQLTVIPSLASYPDKERFFRAPEFASWIEAQRQAYDYVLLDVPPLLRHAEGALVSRLCDGVVIVVEADVTTREMLVRAREQLERVDANVIGVVLNRARVDVPGFLRPYLAPE